MKKVNSQFYKTLRVNTRKVPMARSHRKIGGFKPPTADSSTGRASYGGGKSRGGDIPLLPHQAIGLV